MRGGVALALHLFIRFSCRPKGNTLQLASFRTRVGSKGVPRTSSQNGCRSRI